MHALFEGTEREVKAKTDRALFAKVKWKDKWK